MTGSRTVLRSACNRSAILYTYRRERLHQLRVVLTMVLGPLQDVHHIARAVERRDAELRLDAVIGIVRLILAHIAEELDDEEEL